MAQNRVVARRDANALQEPFAWPTSDAVAKQMNELVTRRVRRARGAAISGQLRDERPPLQALSRHSSVACEASLSPPRLAQANPEGDAHASRAGALKISAIGTDANAVTDRQNRPLTVNLFRAQNSYAQPRGPS